MNTSNSQRRQLLASAALICLTSTAPSFAQGSPSIEVWKDPNCGCCKDWIAHVEKSGFKVTVKDSGNNAVRAGLGMPQKYGSCHTALIQGYVIEGHVPASDILRLPRIGPKLWAWLSQVCGSDHREWTDRPMADATTATRCCWSSRTAAAKFSIPTHEETMNAIKKFLALSVLAVGFALPGVGFTQSTVDHSKMSMPQTAAMTDGEVRKIDKDAGKITLKHGEIKHLDMPAMTMVFTAEDKTLLDGVKVGDKVKFMAVNENGKMVVTGIQAAK